jgi:hypothetical protein
VRRAHLLERLLHLVQLVKAQGLQVDPTTRLVGHLRGARLALPVRRDEEGEIAALWSI